ncbi:MAG: hypothetical protein NUW37_15260 [Planctomycetes bacterium]|nr:hypothetical protein [Planctomycetota bacterium]
MRLSITEIFMLIVVAGLSSGTVLAYKTLSAEENSSDSQVKIANIKDEVIEATEGIGDIARSHKEDTNFIRQHDQVIQPLTTVRDDIRDSLSAREFSEFSADEQAELAGMVSTMRAELAEDQQKYEAEMQRAAEFASQRTIEEALTQYREDQQRALQQQQDQFRAQIENRVQEGISGALGVERSQLQNMRTSMESVQTRQNKIDEDLANGLITEEEHQRLSDELQQEQYSAVREVLTPERMQGFRQGFQDLLNNALGQQNAPQVPDFQLPENVQDLQPPAGMDPNALQNGGGPGAGGDPMQQLQEMFGGGGQQNGTGQQMGGGQTLPDGTQIPSEIPADAQQQLEGAQQQFTPEQIQAIRDRLAQGRNGQQNQNEQNQNEQQDQQQDNPFGDDF